MADFDMSQLSPEQLQALMDMGVLDEQGGQLEEQMQQAEALAKGSGNHYSTAAGAALGGLGDVLRAGLGNRKEGDLRRQQEELLAKKTKGRKTFADLMAGLQTGGMQANPGMQSLGAPQPPSLLRRDEDPMAGYAQFPYGYKPGGY